MSTHLPFAFLGEQAATGGLLLDQISTAADIAASLRKLRSSYNGDCMRITDATATNSTDIGFINDYFDTASVVSFASSYGDTYIETWYDQSGNNRDFISNNTAFFPLIYSSSGNFETLDGFKTIANYKGRLGFDNSTPGS